jgi:TPR repeat protein
MKRLGDWMGWWIKPRRTCGHLALVPVRMLADQGNVFAQHNLGLMYSKGESVPQNSVRGAQITHRQSSR